jgi:hypothetical protein
MTNSAESIPISPPKLSAESLIFVFPLCFSAGVVCHSLEKFKLYDEYVFWFVL